MSPIGGASINWDESKPAGGDSIGIGDNQIRSDKTALRTALDSEHNFPSGGGAATGYHRYGSARAYYGTESQVSSSGTDGRLMLTSDTSRLFGVGSAGTLLMGGSTVLLHKKKASDNDTGTPALHCWQVESGSATPDTSLGTFVVNFSDSGFSGLPTVVASAVSQGLGDNASPVIRNSWAVTIYEVSTTGFEGYVGSTLTLSVNTWAGVTVNWISVGSRLL